MPPRGPPPPPPVPYQHQPYTANTSTVDTPNAPGYAGAWYWEAPETAAPGLPQVATPTKAQVLAVSPSPSGMGLPSRYPRLGG